MFYRNTSEGYTQVLEGIKIKTLVYGEYTLFTEFIMEGGSVLPKHSHPYEQTGYLVNGKILLTIGDEKFEVKPGDSWCIPENIEHNAEIIINSVAVEIFSPVRKDYLKYKPL